jgi:hypothetical protein
VATSTADITTFKILINNTLSTKEAAMMMMDIKNYYLGTSLPRYEYMRMLLSRFIEEIVNKYNLAVLAFDAWVYIEIRKGMYGLKQAGLLANQILQKRLSPFGYYPAHHTPGMWLHKTRPEAFLLIVDDFIVRYVGKQHADHLRDALLRSYELITDWEGKLYSCMTLKWDYNMTHQIIHNTYLPDTSCLFTVPKPSMQCKMKHPLSRQNSVSKYNKSHDPSCTMQEQWTQPSRCTSMILPLSKQKPLKKHKRQLTNC